MSIERLIIRNKLHVAGKGEVLLISLSENCISNDPKSKVLDGLIGYCVATTWIGDGPTMDIWVGSLEIVRVECSQTLTTSPVINDLVGLVTRRSFDNHGDISTDCKHLEKLGFHGWL